MSCDLLPGDSIMFALSLLKLGAVHAHRLDWAGRCMPGSRPGAAACRCPAAEKFVLLLEVRCQGQTIAIDIAREAVAELFIRESNRRLATVPDKSTQGWAQMRNTWVLQIGKSSASYYLLHDA